MWKDIMGWEDYYEVSSNGDVRNKKTQRIITPSLNSAGYYRVSLYNKNHNPNKQRFLLHRLVAMHFLPNYDGLDEVNHISGDKSDNRAENLEWCTRKTNEYHSRAVLHSKPYRPYVVERDDDTLKYYNLNVELAHELNVSTSLVRMWLNNECHSYYKYNIKSIKYLSE